MSVLLELNRGRDEQTQDREAERAQSVKVYTVRTTVCIIELNMAMYSFGKGSVVTHCCLMLSHVTQVTFLA